MEKLSPKTLKTLSSDIKLFGLVAQKLDIKPASLLVAIARNSATLNQYHIVSLIADYLGKPVTEIVEVVNEEV